MGFVAFLLVVVAFVGVVISEEPCSGETCSSTAQKLEVVLNNGAEVVVDVPDSGRALLPASKRFLREGGALFDLREEECGLGEAVSCLASLEQHVCEVPARACECVQF